MMGGRKIILKMLATQCCVQMQKNIRTKQDELTQFITIEKIISVKIISIRKNYFGKFPRIDGIPIDFYKSY